MVLLTSQDQPFERYGNIKLLVEIVREWEEEELLSYSKFVTKLKTLRKRTRENKTDYTVNKLGDFESKERVKLMTIHASKGLEFPIVIIPELFCNDIIYPTDKRRMILDRSYGCYIKPFFVKTGWDSTNTKHLQGPSGGRLFPADLWQGGIFWLSEQRQKDQFSFDSPLNESLKKEIAENWRILYVAMTRAKDHLVLHIPTQKEDIEKEWLKVFKKALEELLGGEVPEKTTYGRSIELSDKQTIQASFYVKPFEAKTPEKVSYVEKDLLQKTKQSKIAKLNYVRYSPITLSAKHLYDLISCPRRYAYATLNMVDTSQLLGAYFKDLPPGANPPSEMSAAEWGTIVHSAFEEIHKKMDRNPSATIKEVKEGILIKTQEKEEVKERISTVLDEYLLDKELVKMYENRTSEFFCEFELQSKFGEKNTNLSSIIVGNIDLFFQTDNKEWVIIDFKTGTPPPAGSYLDQVYDYQLAAYTWLFKKNYPQYTDLKTKVVYIHEKVEIQEKSVDMDKFEREVEQALKINTLVKPEKGFEFAIEEEYDSFGKCETCPYHYRAGGPCR